MDLSRCLISPLPDSEFIGAVQKEINGLTREQYEPFRSEISERFFKSPAFEMIVSGVMRWVQIQVAEGRHAAAIAAGTTGGLLLGAFQLGYLVAKAQELVPMRNLRD